MIYREAGTFKTAYRADQAVFPIPQDKILGWGFVAIAFLVVPFVASDYFFLAILIPFLILALAALGLNLLVGYCGQISLGTGGFMAVGAYAAYKLATNVPQLSLIVDWLLGGVCAGLGQRFGLTPWTARIVFVLLLMVVPGSQILIYPILWILMPSEESVTVQPSSPTPTV